MKTLLEDAAAYATTDDPVDLAPVLVRAGSQRRLRARRARRRGAWTVLAAAAAVALIAVLLPFRSLVLSTNTPADDPAATPAVTGLPKTWYYAPEWTPPVTRHPMSAAVMVLSARLVHTSAAHVGRGPVLVSADAKTYAALPDWGPDDGGVTLIADGTKVAWWTAPGNAPVVVHLLTLRDGVQHDVTIDKLTPSSMVWSRGDLYISGRAEKNGGPRGTYRISPDGRSRIKVCGCAPGELGTDSGGQRLVQSDERQGNALHAVMGYPATQVNSLAEAEGGGIAAPAVVTSPDGVGSVSAKQGTDGAWTIQYRALPLDFAGGSAGPPSWELNDQDYPVRADEPVRSIKLLGWTEGGIFLQVNTSRGPGESVHRSIRVMYPRNGSSKIVSRAQNFQTVPVAIATALVGNATPIPAPPPSFDGKDRAHLEFLAGRAWSLYRGTFIIAGAALLAALLGAGWLIRRRRRPKIVGSATGSAV